MTSSLALTATYSGHLKLIGSFLLLTVSAEGEEKGERRGGRVSRRQPLSS